MCAITITPAEAMLLCGSHVATHYHPGQVLFYQDHLPAGLWLLLQGCLILRVGGQGVASVVGPSLLGASQLLRETPYPNTAEAQGVCTVVFIGKEALSSDDRRHVVQLTRIVAPISMDS